MVDRSLTELGEYIAAELDPDVSGCQVINDQLVVTARAGAICRVLTFLRDDAGCLFEQLTDVTAVDYRSASSASRWSTSFSA